MVMTVDRMCKTPPPALRATAVSNARSVVERAHADHATALVGLALRLGLDEDEAWDAVQEAFMRLWRELCAGEEVRDPRAWLATATYRLAMDRHRLARRIRELRLRLHPPDTTPFADGSDRVAVWTAVDQLPARQRAALLLRYRLNLSFEHIGEAMGITPGAARTLASRGLATLRAQLVTREGLNHE
jgi:RNA polymerase sigma factor (sigma-70 family)